VSLTLLVADNNLLRTVPPVVSLLPRLAVFSANSNAISMLMPETVAGLTHLRGLLLAGNELMVMPDNINVLTGLQVLTLASNQLWHLSRKMSAMT
jgi:Leucine-rich repeat (LRR) protein